MAGRLASPELFPVPSELPGWRWERDDHSIRLVDTTTRWATPWHDDDDAPAAIAIAQRANRVRHDIDDFSVQERSPMTSLATNFAITPDTLDDAPLTTAERQALATHEATVRAGIETFVAVGLALLTINRDRLYRATHRRFDDYVRDRWPHLGSVQHVYRLITAADVTESITNWLDFTGADLPPPINEAQARPLAQLPEPLRGPVFEAAVRTAPDGKVTAAHVQDVVNAALGKEEPTKHVTPRWPELPTPPAPWGWERLASGSCRLINGAQASAWVPQDDPDAIASIIAHVAGSASLPVARPTVPQIAPDLAAMITELGGHIESAIWDDDTPRWSVSTPTGQGGWLSGERLMGGGGRTDAELRPFLAERRAEMQRRLRDRHIAPLRQLGIDVEQTGWTDVNGRQLPQYTLTSPRFWATPQSWNGDQVDMLLSIAGTPPPTPDELPSTADATPAIDSDDWYTPAWLIDAARQVLGGIDLDPASCDAAQAVVQADRYYTKDNDGLSQPWIADTIWLNMPYSQPLPWIQRLLATHESGNVAAVLVLVNLSGSPEWARLLWHSTHLVCVLDKRVGFWRPGGATKGGDRDQMVVLVCAPDDPRRATFRQVFEAFGAVR